MSSEVEICNQALILLGDAPLLALTENNDRARIANRMYAPSRDAVLRAHPWNFAIVRATLAQEATPPEFGYGYQYALPTDPLALRILGVNEDTAGDIDWVIEGRKLLTDETSIQIKYIGRITDCNLFDTLFIDALVARLASKFCLALTKEKSLMEMAWKMYEAVLQEAKSINGLEGTRPAIVSNDLIDARLGGVTYPWEL